MSRRNGYTIRLILRMVHKASHNPGYRGIILFPNNPSRAVALRYAQQITRPFEGFVTYSLTENAILFKNGSSIHMELSHSFNGAPQKFSGVIIDEFEFDNACDALSSKDRMKIWDAVKSRMR